MMSIYQKIMSIYPDLEPIDFYLHIRLRDDGYGVYIDRWEHPEHPRPTEEQLA